MCLSTLLTDLTSHHKNVECEIFKHFMCTLLISYCTGDLCGIITFYCYFFYGKINLFFLELTADDFSLNSDNVFSFSAAHMFFHDRSLVLCQKKPANFNKKFPAGNVSSLSSSLGSHNRIT